MEYHPSHKASSVASTSSNVSSIWESLPSLYTGRADSVSSEIDELPDPSSIMIKKFEDDADPCNLKGLLTEEQKRVNHIASEKRRRHTIKGGFSELNELIPTLKNTNNSKSVILFKSVEYMKQLDKRNKQLKNRLLQLQKKKQRQPTKPMVYHSISIPSDDVFTASVDCWLLNQSNSTPSFNIPAMENDHTYGRERLLSSGKLNHLKQ
ncbi:hypothetical protein G6F56_002179 [Rhizopus delemar]|nr:hypothetical protein G6F56_002179 [Rhizopus delemar]